MLVTRREKEYGLKMTREGEGEEVNVKENSYSSRGHVANQHCELFLADIVDGEMHT